MFAFLDYKSPLQLEPRYNIMGLPQTEVICSNKNGQQFPIILHVNFRILDKAWINKSMQRLYTIKFGH